jgi:hypothetical protein
LLTTSFLKKVVGYSIIYKTIPYHLLLSYKAL